MSNDASPAGPLEIVSAILNLVAELHTKGYQRVRAWPGMSPSGAHWRCAVSYADNVDERGGFDSWDDGDLFPYTSGMGIVTYDADGFLTAFPKIAEHGLGDDAAYAAWFEDLRAKVAEGYVPVLYADYPMREDVVTLLPFAPGLEESELPLPPTPSR